MDEKENITANPVESGATFGLAVGIDGDKIIAGSPFSDLSTNSFQTGGNYSFVPDSANQGAVHFFVNNPSAPIAANVSTSGKVQMSGGQGINNAFVTLTDD